MKDKSQLIASIDASLAKMKARTKKLFAKFVTKFCPKSLHNFNDKYPDLGAVKDDFLSIVKFVMLRLILIFAVIPAIVIGTIAFCAVKIKRLFKKGE